MDSAFLVILQRGIHHLALAGAGGDAHELPVHADRPLLEVDAVPGEADQLALTQACKEIHIIHEIERIVLGDLQELLQLHIRERVHLCLFNHRYLYSA